MPIDPVKHLGNLIKATRKQLNMTQEQLSIKSGVSLRHIANIEKAKASASFEIAYVLIRELHIPADLVLYSDYSKESELFQQTVQSLKAVDEKDLRIIKEFVDFLIKNLDSYKNDD